MNSSNRIKQRRKELGLSQKQVADACGMSQPAFAKIENGGNTSFWVSIAKALDTTPEWLQYGEGEMVFDHTTQKRTYPRAPSEDEYALIPQYSTKGSCGGGELNDHVELLGGLAFKRDWLKRYGLKENSACVIYACGSSMAPTLSDGDVILLDCSSKELRNGKIYALCIDGEVRIKRVHVNFGKITLVSDNQDKLRYPDQEVPADVELDVIGRGVWQGGGL